MFRRIFKFSILLVAIVAVAISMGADVSFAETKSKSKSKAKITVPPGGCLISAGTAALENTKTCAANCQNQWCTVSWCTNGTLTGSWVGCYEPSGLCVPKC